jgi:electron transfer flavoprotein alpha subunit
MQNSKVIVAINKDTNAPIFEFSDLAVVGDVHTILPKLIDLLKNHKHL